MEYYIKLLGLLILAYSVDLLPTSEHGYQFRSSPMKVRQERSPASIGRNSSRSNVKLSDGTDLFLFPDDDPGEKKFIPRFDKTVPECAKESTFCEQVEDYPIKYLQNVLQDEGMEYKNLFGNDILDDTIFHKVDAIDESPLCPSVPQIMYPRVAKNKEDKWLFVVNQDKYVQGIRVEKCQDPDEPPQSCAFADSFPVGYRAYCKQKVVYRKLIALNEGGKTITDDFQIPSCCACVVENETKGFLHSRVEKP